MQGEPHRANDHAPPSAEPDATTIDLGDPIFGAMFETAAAGMGLVDTERRYRWVNRALCTMLGRDAEALLATDPVAVVHPEHVERARDFYARLLDGRSDAVRERLRYHRPDGTHLWAEVGGSTVAGSAPRPLLLVQQLDVTLEQRLTDALSYRAMHDDLTGLANRALLRDRMFALLAHARRVSTRVVAFYLDVDHFKSVNDRFGHMAGDEVLRVTARRLMQVVRAGDTVARIGGDEFVVAGEVAGVEEATRLAERITGALRMRVPFGDGGLLATVSIGVALDAPGDGPNELLARADDSLGRKKRSRGSAPAPRARHREPI